MLAFPRILRVLDRPWSAMQALAEARERNSDRAQRWRESKVARDGIYEGGASATLNMAQGDVAASAHGARSEFSRSSDR